MEIEFKKCKVFIGFFQKFFRCERNMCEIWVFIYLNMTNLFVRVNRLIVDGKDQRRFYLVGVLVEIYMFFDIDYNYFFIIFRVYF